MTCTTWVPTSHRYRPIKHIGGWYFDRSQESRLDIGGSAITVAGSSTLGDSSAVTPTGSRTPAANPIPLQVVLALGQFPHLSCQVALRQVILHTLAHPPR
ncbi:hypothetical protein BDR07DRAFT_1410753 [Suillus spraguei]|nr:hypothetical protein BDR07DRAFT_1410753 [Suillus spraguei]